MDQGRAQQLLDDAAAAHHVPGAQLGLLHRGSRLVMCTGVVADGAGQVVPATAFHAGSLAKALVGLTVLAAARDGVIDLDAPCSEQGEGLWAETPRSVLAQTTGRPNLLPDVDEELATFVARTASLPLVHEPGRFSYCNAGWPALDLLLQRTAGRSFEDLATAALGDAVTFGMPPDAARGHVCAPGQQPREVPAVYSDAATAAGSRWWATADQLLDFALLNLRGGERAYDEEDVLAVRVPTAVLPGSTVFDAWGLGWATWQRGDHNAFGWAGFTGGHRAYLRCFPAQEAALVFLANGAGPLFGPPGGSAAFDELLPEALRLLGVPPLPAPEYAAVPLAPAELAGSFGPVLVEAANGSGDALVLHAQAFGEPDPLLLQRLGGNTFTVTGSPPGATPVAFDDDLLYVGPFALPRG